MRVDSCNRLWVLDAGISRSLEDYEKTCPPKILVFDIKSNQVVRRIDFPAGVLRGESLFTNLVIDETTAKDGTCDDVFVYISDTVEPGKLASLGIPSLAINILFVCHICVIYYWISVRFGMFIFNCGHNRVITSICYKSPTNNHPGGSESVRRLGGFRQTFYGRLRDLIYIVFVGLPFYLF